jgi:hypothetical protein
MNNWNEIKEKAFMAAFEKFNESYGKLKDLSHPVELPERLVLVEGRVHWLKRCGINYWQHNEWGINWQSAAKYAAVFCSSLEELIKHLKQIAESRKVLVSLLEEAERKKAADVEGRRSLYRALRDAGVRGSVAHEIAWKW